MEMANRSTGVRASAPDEARTRFRRKSVSKTGRKIASVLSLCGMLATSGCAHTYHYENGGNMAKDIQRDYVLTALLVPMVIGGILAASSR